MEQQNDKYRARKTENFSDYDIGASHILQEK
jgi:hypothetical protein